jgi:hypothetical protein
MFGVQLWDRTVTKQSRFHCFLTAVHFIPVSVFNFSEMITLGLVMFSWLCFQMNIDNYPHVTITEDGILCSRAGITRGSHECCTTYSASSATTGTLLSTMVACLWPMAMTSAGSMW